MNWTLEGGTDGAVMAVFDPAALPEGFDQSVVENPIDALTAAEQQGRACLMELDSDGSYSLRLQMNEGLPSETEKLAKVFKRLPLFRVVGGKVYFTGAEYAFRQNAALLQKYSLAGEFAEVPVGDYELMIYEMDYPENFYEEHFQKEMPPEQFRIRKVMDWFAPIGCAAFLVLLGSFFFMPRKTWLLFILPVFLLLVVVPLIISRLPLYKLADKTAKEIEKRYPDFIAVLKPIAN